MTPGWTVGKCCHEDCPMTMVRYIGGGLWICWLHLLMVGGIRG